MASMESALGAVIKGLPGLINTFAYPWFAKPQLAQFVGGMPNAEFICDKLIASFTNPPATIPITTTVPEEAFALTMQQVIVALTGIDLSVQDLGPLVVKIGETGRADPDLAEPVAA